MTAQLNNVERYGDQLNVCHAVVPHCSALQSDAKKRIHIYYCIQQQMCIRFFASDFIMLEGNKMISTLVANVAFVRSSLQQSSRVSPLSSLPPQIKTKEPLLQKQVLYYIIDRPSGSGNSCKKNVCTSKRSLTNSLNLCINLNCYLVE